MRQLYDKHLLIKWAVAIVVILWIFGSKQLTVIHTPILTILGRSITIEHLLLFSFFGYLAYYLPRRLQTIVAILFFLWIGSQFVDVGIGWLGNAIIVGIVIVVFFYIY